MGASRQTGKQTNGQADKRASRQTGKETSKYGDKTNRRGDKQGF